MKESCESHSSTAGESDIAQALRDCFTTGEFTSAENLPEALILIAHQLGRIADALEGIGDLR
jgi:hypothetical protein